jgi:hypothetical protein
MIAPILAIGKPKPEDYTTFCGYAFWFWGVSGIETVVPSNM